MATPNTAELSEFSADLVASNPDETHIALLRHGFSLGNSNRGVIQPSDLDPAFGLHQIGEHQARRLGGLVLDRGVIPRAVRVSPLPRARQTGALCLGIVGLNPPQEFDDRFVELCKGKPGKPGGMEGRRRQEVETPEYKQAFLEQSWQFRHGSQESGGETAQEVALRVAEGLDEFADYLDPFDQLERPGWAQVGFVFTHAQAIRFGLGPMLDWPDLFEVINKEYTVGNGCGIVVRRSKADKTWSVAGQLTIQKES